MEKEVGLVFKKNYAGDAYIYVCPFIYYTKGESQGRVFRSPFYPEEIIFDGQRFAFTKSLNQEGVKQQLDKPHYKLNDNQDIVVFLPMEKYDQLASDFEKVRNKTLSDNQVIHLALIYADCLGKSIEKISAKKSLTGFYSLKKKDIPPVENMEELLDIYSSDKGKILICDMFNYKPEEKKVASQNGDRDSKQDINRSEVEPEMPRLKRTEEKRMPEPAYNTDGSVNLSNQRIKEIKEELKRKIKCQDEAIDKIVNSICLHQRVIDSDDEALSKLKANILLDGPTGTGKTFILEETAKHLHLPIKLVGSTNFSTTGYKGADLTDILESLLQQAKGDVELAERSIVVFDEFDKLGQSPENGDNLGMLSKLQDELLTFIGGSTYTVQYGKETVEFDTSNLTIVGLGAFTNLRERKIKENSSNRQTIGFVAPKDAKPKRNEYEITKQDYIDEGLHRELVGRFTCLASTNELSVENLEEIMRDSSTGLLASLKAFGAMNDCEITIDDAVIHQIAVEAFNKNTGARALTDVFNSIRNEISNDIIDGVQKIHIDQAIFDKAVSNNVHRYYERGNSR